MCRIDGAERSISVQDKDRFAIKNHRCGECGRTIMAGEKYHYDTTIYEGSRDSFKTCGHCMVGRAWLLKNCGGFIYTEIMDEVREHAEEYPKLAMPLLRLCAAARRKWQGRNGLMPLPAPPPDIEAHYT
jgi:hypothetical protein